MLKIVFLTLFLATAAYSQGGRDYSHTVILKDGSRVTYRTHCSGTRDVHCTTSVSERGPRGVGNYKGPPMCKEMRKTYGDNLERFAEPIGNDLIPCIKDNALRVRIRLANLEEIKHGREGKTMNPLYKPPQ